LATLTIVLHRKIVHEEVLRQLLERRYGYWFGFWSVPELMLGLPVFYRHLASRYYLLRDIVPFLPRLTRQQRKIQRATIPQTHLLGLEPRCDTRPSNEIASPVLQGPCKKALEGLAKRGAPGELNRGSYSYKGKP